MNFHFLYSVARSWKLKNSWLFENCLIAKKSQTVFYIRWADLISENSFWKRIPENISYIRPPDVKTRVENNFCKTICFIQPGDLIPRNNFLGTKDEKGIPLVSRLRAKATPLQIKTFLHFFAFGQGQILRKWKKSLRIYPLAKAQFQGNEKTLRVCPLSKAKNQKITTFLKDLPFAEGKHFRQ